MIVDKFMKMLDSFLSGKTVEVQNVFILKYICKCFLITESFLSKLREVNVKFCGDVYILKNWVGQKIIVFP